MSKIWCCSHSWSYGYSDLPDDSGLSVTYSTVKDCDRNTRFILLFVLINPDKISPVFLHNPAYQLTTDSASLKSIFTIPFSTPRSSYALPLYFDWSCLLIQRRIFTNNLSVRIIQLEVQYQILHCSFTTKCLIVQSKSSNMKYFNGITFCRFEIERWFLVILARSNFLNDSIKFFSHLS